MSVHVADAAADAAVVAAAAGGAGAVRARSSGRFRGAPVCADATRRHAQKSSGVRMMFSRVRHEYGSIGDASGTL